MKGEVFNRWTILEDGSNKVKARCICGVEKYIFHQNAKQGKSKSCGCLTKESARKRMYIHGKSKNRLYNVWNSMHQRCENSNNQAAYRYKNRGITVCEDWKTFIPFEKWWYSQRNDLLGEIDRIDNNKGYYPGNCRIVSSKIQQRNRRNNKIIYYLGKKKCLAEWCEILSLPYHTIKRRINSYGYMIEEAFTTPLRKPKNIYKEILNIHLKIISQ